MSEDEECIHELTPESCSICKHGIETNKPEKVHYAFHAKYEGECPECVHPINIGDVCFRTTKDRTLHQDCFK